MFSWPCDHGENQGQDNGHRQFSEGSAYTHYSGNSFPSRSVLPPLFQEDPGTVSAEASNTGGSPSSWVLGCALSLGLQSLGAAAALGGGALLCQRHGPGSARDPGSWVAVPSITPGHLSRLRLERWGRLLPRLGHRAARIQIRASTP